MKRTITHLADGRELIYFDRRDDADRSAIDRRRLDPRPPASELRYDPLTEEWIAIAGHRQTRTFLPTGGTAECPLCPSSDERATEIPSYDYDVVVFENRFPSFSGNFGTYEPVGGLSEVRPGVGRCEVVCFTSDHDSSFSALSDEQVVLVMEAWADRTAELSGIEGVEQVFCFENRGAEIGITIAHPHGQIYAYPYVTPRTKLQLGAAERYKGPGNLFADVLAAERAEGTRVVASNELWTAFVPAAARWPFEVHIYPHRQVPDLAALTDAERAAFAPLYTSVLRAFDGLFGIVMPYISAWHQAPVRTGRDLAYLHLELFSIRRAPNKLKYLAGSESAMGAFVNDVRPEEAARMIRSQIDH
ncbi:galactose-1-phosphate uridylyltransferase [Nonomuraea sp. NPDC049309]|uniref:galactose-1-phosphate uridylyltransferase n=1 Tax=Nonomuraea sp. NPDC049309 TaxID=3364350 RepID=UPI00371D1552